MKDADIKTSALTLERTLKTERDPQGHVTSLPSGYAASDVIQIRTRDMSRVGGLTQSLIDSGLNSLNGIQFSVEHEQPILDKLATQAIADGQRHATMAVHAAGAKLGPVLLMETLDTNQQFRFGGGAFETKPLPI